MSAPLLTTCTAGSLFAAWCLWRWRQSLPLLVHTAAISSTAALLSLSLPTTTAWTPWVHLSLLAIAAVVCEWQLRRLFVRKGQATRGSSFMLMLPWSVLSITIGICALIMAPSTHLFWVLPAICATGCCHCLVAAQIAGKAGRAPLNTVTVINTLFGYGWVGFTCLNALWFLWAQTGKKSHSARFIMKYGTRFFYAMAIWVAPGVRSQLLGTERMKGRKAVVVANHESILDVLLLGQLPGLRALSAKDWIFRTPFLSFAAHLAGVRRLDAVLESLRRGRPAAASVAPYQGLSAFIEGRRSASGGFRRFHRGALDVAAHMNVAVQPVVIAGTGPCLSPSRLAVRPSLLLAEALPPMPSRSNETIRQWLSRIRVAMQQRYQALQGQVHSHNSARSRRRAFACGMPPDIAQTIRLDVTPPEAAFLASCLAAVPKHCLLANRNLVAAALVLHDRYPAMSVNLDTATARDATNFSTLFGPAVPEAPIDLYLCQTQPPVPAPNCAQALVKQCTHIPVSWYVVVANNEWSLLSTHA